MFTISNTTTHNVVESTATANTQKTLSPAKSLSEPKEFVSHKTIPSKVQLLFDDKSQSVVAKMVSLDGEVIGILPSENVRKLHASLYNKQKGLLLKTYG